MNEIYQTLRQYFGYTSFRPLQKEIIQDVLSKKDVFALMPTGGGKSLCYQLPSLLLDGVTIVVSPLISLMKDQVDTLKFNGVRAAFLNSTLSISERDFVLQQLRKNSLSILYIAPERLMQEATLEFFNTIKIRQYAIDEAHCISEWGHEFRPEYRQLKTLKMRFPGIPIIALTATATSRVKQDIIQQLDLTDARIYQASFNRHNLHYIVQRKENDLEQIAAYLRDHFNQSGIVYCQTRDDVDTLSSELEHEGFSVLPYHAGLEEKVRRENQERFKRDDVQVIVATVAFGMGIDKPNVRFVIHHGIPPSIERYYQETGRAGRDGLPSDCILLYRYSDTRTSEFFISQMENPQEQEILRQKLRDMITFAETNLCRRVHMLKYFGETYEKPKCESCDNCVQPADTFDATILSKKIISCIFRVQQRFGVSYIAKILTGSRAAQIRQNGHDKLSTYNIVQDMTRLQVTECIRQLARLGYLYVTTDTYPIVKLTGKSADILKNNEKIFLHKPKKDDVQFVTEAGQPFDQTLFEQLRRLRKRLADEEDVPPYIIFSDASLKDMAIMYPQTKDQFASMKGVGQQKLRQYADVFVEVIQSYCVPLGIQPKQRTKRQRTPRRNSSINQTFELYRQGLSLYDIARRRGFAESTIASHLEEAYILGMNVNINDFVSSKKQEKIMRVFKELKTDRLSPVKEKLGEDYSYNEIRFVRAQIQKNNTS